jgi:hypothetical protein
MYALALETKVPSLFHTTGIRTSIRKSAMAILYADVAIILSIPVYVTDFSTTGRLPGRIMYARCAPSTLE